MKQQLKAFDTVIARYVTKLPSEVQQPFTVIGRIASPLAWAIILSLVLLLFRPDARFWAFVALLPLASLIKFAFRRKRPPTIYAGSMRIKSYSFPSSHSYSSALSAYLLITLSVIGGVPLLGVVAVLYSLLVAMSRIYLGAHYPSDVIAGYILGVCIGITLTGFATN